jgi:hypothetical protein
MHSFQRSRANILFEVACALALSASFAAAWQQTGAPALIAAAGVAGLYGLVHLFDLRQRQAGAVTVEAVAIQAPGPVAEPVPSADAPASKPSRAKAPRKGAKAAAKPKLVAEPVAEPVADPEAFEPVVSIPLAPLFEPEPFVRQPRAFGRKAG